MARQLLTATTSAAQSDPFTCAGDKRLPAHFTAPGLAGTEVAVLQKKSLDGSWYDYYVDNIKQEVTATHSGVVAYAPGEYRLDKEATAAAVGVELSTEDSP